MDKKPKPIGMLHPDPSHMQGYTKTQKKGWRKIYQPNGEREKKGGVAILVSDKIDFKSKKMKRDKEVHSLMVKGQCNKKSYLS